MLHNRNTRALAVVALCTLLAVMAATATSLHRHDNASRDACQLCHVAHMPALESSAGAQALPPTFLAWNVPAKASHPGLDPVLGAGPSRAPPLA
jgi:hypothetical protein